MNGQATIAEHTTPPLFWEFGLLCLGHQDGCLELQAPFSLPASMYPWLLSASALDTYLTSLIAAPDPSLLSAIYASLLSAFQYIVYTLHPQQQLPLTPVSLSVRSIYHSPLTAATPHSYDISSRNILLHIYFLFNLQPLYKHCAICENCKGVWETVEIVWGSQQESVKTVEN